MSKLAIDFDGVIHNPKDREEGRKMGRPFPDSKESLARLKDAGHDIILHSTKPPSVVANWMAYYEIPYTTIWCGNGKPQADVYIDDKAIEHLSWRTTLMELVEHEIRI